MKIGLVLESFDPGKGGLEQWTWQFAQRLIAVGHELHIVACTFAPWPSDPAPYQHRIPPSRSPLMRAAAMADTLEGLNLDVVHDMGTGWKADLFHPHGGSSRAFREHNLMRIPRWRQIRFWREKRYQEHTEIEDRQHADKEALIVAVSEMVRDHFLRFHSLTRDHIRVIPNGVDTTRFSPARCQPIRQAARTSLSCRDDESLFLLVAHNLQLKNARTALQAFAKLTNTGASARFAIVGSRKTKPFLRLAERLGIAERVSLIGPVEDSLPYYAAADIHLHPTWYDPCSLVALEALACGRPLITTRYNGVSEMMTEGKEGFVLDDPADSDLLADRMTRLLDPELRSKMGSAARELALNHTLGEQTESFLSLYREIIIFRVLRDHSPAFPGPWRPDTSFDTSGANLSPGTLTEVISKIEQLCGLSPTPPSENKNAFNNPGGLIQHIENLAHGVPVASTAPPRQP